MADESLQTFWRSNDVHYKYDEYTPILCLSHWFGLPLQTQATQKRKENQRPKSQGNVIQITITHSCVLQTNCPTKNSDNLHVLHNEHR